MTGKTLILDYLCNRAFSRTEKRDAGLTRIYFALSIAQLHTDDEIIKSIHDKSIYKLNNVGKIGINKLIELIKNLYPQDYQLISQDNDDRLKKLILKLKNNNKKYKDAIKLMKKVKEESY